MNLDNKIRTSIAFSSGNHEEKFLVDMFHQISDRLKNEFNYSETEIFKLWNSEMNYPIPITIFSGNLSPAEAIAKFLKENHNLSYSEISALIDRDERGVWANYKRAAKKMPWAFQLTKSITVPVSIFNSKKSILESLIFYLKDVKKMRNKNIAELLNKNTANVWTVYNRALKKESEEKNEL
jgi:hypothetical protein